MNSYISQEEVVEFTREIVRAPSINPPADTSECARIILEKFKENHIEAEIVEPKKGVANVVARLSGGKKGKILLFNGHIDVVAPGDGWTVDPFGGVIRDNKIYGRGTCDMKSGVACMVVAMIGLKRSGISFQGGIIFTGVADEETGSEFGTLYLLKKNIGRKANFAVVSEPTSLRVNLGNRGLRWIDVVVRGKASHAGRPHLGVNAIFYGAKLVEAIQAMRFENRNEAFEIPTPTISVTTISGGTKVNIIPDRCDLALDRRMIPGETTETVLEELQAIIDPILAEEKDLQVEVSVRPNYWDAYLLSEKEPVVQATIESFKQVTGREPSIGGKAACTDASHLFHLGGIPTVLFGPGDESLSHKADECVPVGNLMPAIKIYMAIGKRLLGE